MGTLMGKGELETYALARYFADECMLLAYDGEAANMFAGGALLCE